LRPPARVGVLRNENDADRAKLAARFGYPAQSYRGKSHQANALFAFPGRQVIEEKSGFKVG